MQNVTDAVKQLVDAYALVTLSVYIDGEKVDAGIDTGSYSGACMGDDAFTFGNACAASVNIELAVSRPDLNGHRIQIRWSVDGTEYPLLTGQVEKAKVTAGHTAVEAWDDMYFAGSSAFEIPDALLLDCDAAVAFEAVAAAMGVTAEEKTLTLLSGITIAGGLADVGSDATNSAVAGHIAGLVGGNALMTRDGQLAVRQYTDTGWETEPYSGGASAENEDFSVTGVTLQREITTTEANEDGTTTEQTATAEYTAGDGSLMLSNPLASQDAADLAFAVLEAVTVRPGSFSFPGGLLLEPGDIFTVHSMDGSYAVAVGSIAMDFDGGVKSSVACGGAVETEGSGGPLNQALKAFLADYAKFKKLYANNAHIVSAKINHLEVDDIDVDRIDIKALFAKDINMTGKFECTSEAYLPLTEDDAMYLVRSDLVPDRYPLPDGWDGDLDGNGVFDTDDAAMAVQVALGEIKMQDCPGAIKTPVTISIDLSDPYKVVHIYGDNVMGTTIESFIGIDKFNCSFAAKDYLDSMMRKEDNWTLFRYAYGSSNSIKEYWNPPLKADVEYHTVERLNGNTVLKKWDSATEQLLYSIDSGSTWTDFFGLYGKAALLDRIYPVGSIYMSVNATSPADLFGGTWEAIEDTFLLAAGSTYAAGNTGGEATHKLTAAESGVPAHTHTAAYSGADFYIRHGNAEGRDTVAPGTNTTVDEFVGDTWTYGYSVSSYSHQTDRVNINGTVSVSKNTAAAASTAHNNMPPYLAVYVWTRTA